MKLRKRIMACVVAAAVVVTSAVTAMAAGSIDKNGKVNGNQIPNGYKLEVTKKTHLFTRKFRKYIKFFRRQLLL